LRYRGRLVPFLCFALVDPFSAVTTASGPVFLFCDPRVIFGGTEGIRSLFHVLRSWTRFRRYRGRRFPFSCFALTNSFSEVPEASGPVFMFCALGLIFGGTEGVRSRYHVLSSRTHFAGTGSVGSHFHVLRLETRFPRYRRRRVPFSCFALPDPFSVVPNASGPIFRFCAPRLIFCGTKGAGSHFNVLRCGTHFQRDHGCWVPFSCFAPPSPFSSELSASGPVFMFCAPELIFDGTEGVESRFHVLRSRNHFRQCQGRRVPLRPDSFSAVPRASGPVFMFCAAELIFGDTKGVVSHFHILRSRTHFRRYRERRVPFSCFPLPTFFFAVPRASGFVFYAPELIFDGTEGVGSPTIFKKSNNLFN
jgi:hypothetical protein